MRKPEKCGDDGSSVSRMCVLHACMPASIYVRSCVLLGIMAGNVCVTGILHSFMSL